MKTFVLDTNILLHDTQAVLKFEENEVIIPLSVIEDLDEMKKRRDDLGFLARETLKFLASLKNYGKGSLFHGVTLDTGGVVKVLADIPESRTMPFSKDKASSKVVLASYHLKAGGKNVILVSNDFAARVKAESLGIKASDYDNLKIAYDSLYKGFHTRDADKATIDEFYKNKILKAEKDEKLLANEYCLFKSPENSSCVTRYNPSINGFDPLVPFPEKGVRGVKPLNVEQRCAFDLLLRDDIKLVTLVGKAGTGKTLLAIASALYKVFNDAAYSRILVSRPVVPLGNDIGFLPGTKEEKLAHWMQPIYDNLEYLMSQGSSGGNPSNMLKDLIENKKIEMEAVAYIRGRSLPNMFIIIDEAQNLTPHEVKTVISRAGKGTKVVLTGDPSQIDNPYLDKETNGLTLTVARFKGQKIFGHMHLEHTERSELAALATKLF